MKQITAIDLFCIVREIQLLRNARVERIYQPQKKELLLALYHPKYGKGLLRIIAGHAIHITRYKEEFKNFPSHFCMFLRKYLNNAYLRDAKQRKNDRIVELTFETKDGLKCLICELFDTGNIILTDSEYTIIAVEQVRIFHERAIMVHKKYEQPKESISPINMNSITFRTIISTSKKSSIVRAIAADAGAGGKYAEEICLRARIQKETPVEALSRADYEMLYSTMDYIIRQLKYKPLTPQIILKEERYYDYTPIDLEIYKDDKKIKTNTFNEAIDEYYTKTKELEIKDEAEKEFEKEKEKLETIKKQQEETIKEYSETSGQKRETGETIINQIHLIQQLQTAINNARNNGKTWEEINTLIEAEKQRCTPAALILKRIEPADNSIILTDNTTIKLDKNAGLQASQLYEQAKKIETKIESAQEHTHKIDDRIQELEERGVEIKDEHLIPKEVEIKEAKSWFETFKYFYTHHNRLVIAGKDAVQNEILIKKYMEDDDVIFHADLPGSPFGLLKSKGAHDNEDLEQAGIFIASHSRSWKEGFGTADVYWINPPQLSKEGGLQKGSFMIYGRRNYLYGLELRLAIGLENGKIISGPEQSVKTRTDNYILIKPGYTSQQAISKQIKEKINYRGNSDDIIQHLPSGESDIIEQKQEPLKDAPITDMPLGDEDTEKEEKIPVYGEYEEELPVMDDEETKTEDEIPVDDFDTNPFSDESEEDEKKDPDDYSLD